MVGRPPNATERLQRTHMTNSEIAADEEREEHGRGRQEELLSTIRRSVENAAECSPATTTITQQEQPAE
jgi:hypothetical protein